MNDTIREFAAVIASKIKIKGFIGWFKNAVIEGAIMFGWSQMQKKPAIANEFHSFVQAYLIADKNGMVDEAADLLAAVFKLIFYPDLIPDAKASRLRYSVLVGEKI